MTKNISFLIIYFSNFCSISVYFLATRWFMLNMENVMAGGKFDDISEKKKLHIKFSFLSCLNDGGLH
ncbi:MAG TPA: hypothetical protein QF468_14565 [Nitrospinota bacterium]|nr:hypothetical protein [Nitrospinota bacterium]